MIKTLNSIMEIRGASGANWLIYYFKRIPGLGKLLKDDLYAQAALKKILAVIANILKAIWGVLSKFAYLGIMVYWPVLQAGEDRLLSEQYDMYLQVLVLISFVVAAVSNAVIMEPKRDKYICVKLMRLPADRYMHSTLAFKGVSFFVYFIPAMITFAVMFDAPVWQGVWLSLLLTAWRTVGEACHLAAFHWKKMIVVKNTGIVWTVIVVGFLLAYVPLYAGKVLITSEILFSLPLLLVVLMLAIFAVIYIARYPDYREAVDAVTKKDEPLLDMGRMMKEARVADVKTKEKDFTADQLRPDQFAGKSGYAYLNAIFFSRHRRFLIQPIQRRLGIIGGLFAAGLLIMIIAPEVFSKLAVYLIDSLSLFFIIMNFTSIGERICKAMFFNCDLSLLRYGFYREPAAILSNFRTRLLRIGGLNLIPAAAICVAVNVLILLSDEGWGMSEILIFCATILGLSLFFSVHHLFMYYIFQPYSTELNVKNPFFSILNSIVLAIGIVCLRVQGAPGYFALTVLIAAFFYMGLALLLVYRFSGRTFRVK